MKKISKKFNPRSVKTPRIPQAIALAVVLAAFAPYASAATFTWSGATPLTSTNWSAGTNWDTVPVSGSTTTLTFTAATGASGTTTTVNDNSGNFLLNSLNLNGTGAGATYSGTSVISGGVLEFTSNGATNPTVNLNATNTTGSNSFLIKSNIVLDNDTTFTGNGAGVGSAFNFAGSFSGTGSIIKTGNSWLTLSGTNGAYSGNVTVSAGKVLFAGVNSSNLAWVSTGTLSIAAGATAGNVSGLGFAGFSALTGNGTLDFSSNRYFELNYNGTGTDTFNGAINGTLFAKNGTGKVVLTSTMTTNGATGALFVFGGELDAPALGGTAGYVFINGGTLKLTGANSTGSAFSGMAGSASILQGGTLAISPSGSGGDVVITGGTNAGSNGVRLTNGTLLLDKGGYSSLTFVLGNSSTNAQVVSYAGALLKAASGLDKLGTATGEKLVVVASSSAYLPQLTNNMAPAGLIGQDTDANLSGDFLTYIGTGLATDTGFTRFDYTNATYADTNFASASNTKVEAVTSAQSLAGTTNAVYALKNSSVITLNSGSKLTVGGTVTSSTSGIILNGGSIVGAGTLNLASASANTGYIYTSLANGTISSLLTVPTYLNINGPGVLTYNGASVLNTQVTIDAGATLDVPLAQMTGYLLFAGGVLQTNGSLTKSLGTAAGNISMGVGTSAAGGGFAARGGSLTVNLGGNATPSTLTWNYFNSTGGTANFLEDGAPLYFGSQTADSEVIFKNNLDLGSTTANFSRVISVYDNVNSATDLARITGVISSTSDNNQLVKDGAGTLVLEAANTYKGSTIISAGTLQLGYGGATGSLSTSSAIVDNGVFAINRSNAVTQGTDFSGAAITGTGAFVQAGSGVTTLTAANTYTGVTTVSAGTLKVDGSIVSGTVNVTGATLAGSGTASGKVNVTGGTISGNGLHLGATTLKGVNSLNGTTTASSITVADGSTTVAGSATSTAALSVSVGATLINSGTIHGDVNVNGLLKGTGAVDGALTLNGTLGLGVTGTTAAGVDYDQISVNGNVTLGGVLNFTSLSGLSAMGDKITLILNTNDSAITTGAFSVISLNGIAQTVVNNTFTVGTTEYQIDYNAIGDSGVAENDVLLTVVPEPSTWAMVLGGLGLLIGVQRIQRSNRKGA